MTTPRDEFFIGWAGRTGRGLGRFVMLVSAIILLGLGLAGIVLAARVDDPANTLFRVAADDPSTPPDPIEAAPERTLTGVVTLEPYAVLHLARDASHPNGHDVLLVGDGKNAAPIPIEAAHTTVTVHGVLMHRGTIDMLVVDQDPTPAPDQAEPRAPERLGRWRITGEICDGKCNTGAMRPGSGLAHRACANLCLIGGVPPVFVAAEPVAGTPFMLLAGPAGGPLPDSVRDLVALRVTLEGELERRGDMLVFKVDLDRARLL